MSRISVSAVVIVALLLVGCSSGSQSREAAGIDGMTAGSVTLPVCDMDSTSTCASEVSLAGEDRVIVSNGATVVFTRKGEPVQTANLGVLCWSPDDDVEAGTCTDDGKQPPAEVDIRASTVSVGGKQWPPLAITVRPLKDDQGEEYLPLPATALMSVTTDEGTLPITVEVACCHFLP